MPSNASADELFELLELTDYEAQALEHLLSMGRTTAPTLAEAAGIPKARIYGVLDALADAGFVEVIPDRPKEYRSKSPGDLLDRAIENRRQEYERHEQRIESVRESFVSEFQPVFESASENIRPAEELFHVVDVGEPSERETQRIYHDAQDEAYVLTKSFDYLETVEPAIDDAVSRGVTVKTVLVDPDLIEPEKRDRQAEIVARLNTEFPDIAVRFSNRQLPWRGTFIDPSMDYTSGKAILLVEEDDVPNYLRQAAITENGSFVAGLKRFFDLVWEFDSRAER